MEWYQIQLKNSLRLMTLIVFPHSAPTINTFPFEDRPSLKAPLTPQQFSQKGCLQHIISKVLLYGNKIYWDWDTFWGSEDGRREFSFSKSEKFVYFDVLFRKIFSDFFFPLTSCFCLLLFPSSFYIVVTNTKNKVM